MNNYEVWSCVGPDGVKTFMSYEKCLDGAMCVSDMEGFG